MKNKGKFSIRKRLNSFRYAIEGLVIGFKEEHNVRIHLFAFFIVVLSGIYFQFSQSEWFAVWIVSGLVISLEMMNSAIENLADFISPEKHNLIKKAKDIAAGAVLISAIIAVLVAFTIFIPRIIDLLK